MTGVVFTSLSTTYRLKFGSLEFFKMEADNVMFALKILSRWMDGQRPLPEEIKRLQSCMPEMSHIAPDQLACAVVREHQKRFWHGSSDHQPFAPASQSRF